MLPSLNPPLDVNSLNNLRPRNLQTLHYEQVFDRSVPVAGYRATIDYVFQVPSIVFDHSSLIYVINQTDQTIVFGFGNADAFAQTLGWPTGGIAMLFKGECLSTSANDVFMLSGFIYDASRLTVAANFTPSQIANISTNTNVTFGRNDTSSTNTSEIGNPQPYLPNARYVDPSFFSNRTSRFDNAYYTRLNASVDSQLDSVSGCYFNSLAQALIYDIVDPRNYNDRQAYNDLAGSVTSQNQASSSRSIEASATKNDRTARQMNVFDFGDINGEQAPLLHRVFSPTNTLLSQKNADSSLSNSRRRRRRRRILRSRNVYSSSIRNKRIFGSIGNFVKGAVGNAVDSVKGAFKAVADVTKKAVDGISEVGKIVKTAIAGGEYEKSGQININIGYDQPEEIFSGNGIYVNCQECKVDGAIDLRGKFNYEKDGLATVLKEGFVEATGRIEAKAVARIGVNVLIEKSKTVATIPLTPITVPGIFALGPYVALDVGVRLEVGGELQVTFGAHISWNEIYTKIDFKNSANSQSRGWTPSNIDPQLSYETKLTADLGVFVKPKIEIGLTILNGVIRVGAGLSAQCTAGVTATSSDDPEKCSGGIQLAPYVGVALSVYAEANLASNSLASEQHTIFEEKAPIGSGTCIGGGQATTPNML